MKLTITKDDTKYVKLAEDGLLTVDYRREVLDDDHMQDIDELEIGEGIAALAPYAFHSAVNLRRLILPDTLVKIGPDAFFCCDKLEEIVVPPTLSFIDDSAFVDSFHIRRVVVRASKFEDEPPALAALRHSWLGSDPIEIVSENGKHIWKPAKREQKAGESK